ncbi:hypothetical protein AVEN_218501-1 [Araneus ventricosus]|uniref:Mos1 transposase HTH domain-containing protein n=1 Tax=Araneus ventricosus TaxID=182803 RepID=A0A4Y2I7R4_ARAVE|nr:hypothetical protein AVEN_218501-1 [Araneus ventricosus]
MDSSRSAQRAVIHFLRTKGEHASQIFRRMKEVYGEQCLARCTIFRWCQRYEVGRVNIKDNVTNIIHKKLGYGKVCAQWVSRHLPGNQKTARMRVCLTQ